MKNILKCSIFFFSLLMGRNCFSQSKSSLKSVFKNDFLIGAALGAEHILEKNPKANTLILREFNSITPENVMKAMVIHPEIGKYDFALADKFVTFGQKNKMQMVGHALVWHSQATKNIAKITNPDSLRAYFKDHINTVVGRYTGKINSWDVVNEALNDDGTMRKSHYYNTLGESYIKEAFDLAAKADPNAELYYNDYNIEQPVKRAGAIALIQKLQASGTKIDGVGIQGHWSIVNTPIKEVEDAIVEFSKLGIKVAFTELDITVIPNPWELKGADVKQSFNDYIGDPKMNPYTTELPDSIKNKLANSYANLFRVFLKHKDKISRVTFWGVNDAHSWLNDWPIKGRTNYPLLFDRKFNRKKAYSAVINSKTSF